MAIGSVSLDSSGVEVADACVLLDEGVDLLHIGCECLLADCQRFIPPLRCLLSVNAFYGRPDFPSIFTEAEIAGEVSPGCLRASSICARTSWSARTQASPCSGSLLAARRSRFRCLTASPISSVHHGCGETRPPWGMAAAATIFTTRLNCSLASLMVVVLVQTGRLFRPSSSFSS